MRSFQSMVFALLVTQKGSRLLDRADGLCILVIERPATDPIKGVLCCFCALLIAALIVACSLSFVLKLIMQGNIDDLQQPSPRPSMPRPRYGGPEPWRARCLPARTLFTVSSWPPVARNSSRRWRGVGQRGCRRGWLGRVGCLALERRFDEAVHFQRANWLTCGQYFPREWPPSKPAGSSRKRAAMVVAAAAATTAAASVAPDAGTDPRQRQRARRRIRIRHELASRFDVSHLRASCRPRDL